MPLGSSPLPTAPDPAHLEPGPQARGEPSQARRQAGRCPLGSQAGVPEGARRPSGLQSCFAVVLGGPQETGQLLEHKFDYIFFTGEEPVWGSCGMGEVRSLPGPTLRGLIPNSERGTEAASQPGRMQTGASAGWCSRPQDELAPLSLRRLGSSPGPLGTLGRDGPHPGNRPLHHSPPHTSQHLSLLSSRCARCSFLRPRPFWRAGQMRVWGLG